MTAEDLVPVLTSLNEFYTSRKSLQDAEERVGTLKSEFLRLYSQEPSLISRAPGRVNLIGEHIDYEGYSVLPMAIEYDTFVAIRTYPVEASQQSGLIRVANVESDKYSSQEYASNPWQTVDLSKHSWANYFVCGYKGVYDYCVKELKSTNVADALNMDVLVHGTVPTGAGVSSSAAIVCSSFLAVMAVLGFQLPKSIVAERACQCERYIGTQSGGMDQAISITAEPGVAKLIEFNPIRTHNVALPAKSTFVISHSLAVSKKAETAATNYNRRVVECRLAAMVLATKLLGSSWKANDVATKMMTLHDFENAYFCSEKPKYVESAENDVERSGATDSNETKTACAVVSSDALNDGLSFEAKLVRLEKLAALSGESLHGNPYTFAELEDILKRPLREMFSLSDTSLMVLNSAQSGPGFELRKRALHVFSESARVLKFAQAARETKVFQNFGNEKLDGNSKNDPQQDVAKLKRLGELMDLSHASCRDLYECSCAELDELVVLCKELGAYGARLTGAGWGGCVVSLVAEDRVRAFKKQIRERFHRKRVESGVISQKEFETAGWLTFDSKPAAGAFVLKL